MKKPDHIDLDAVYGCHGCTMPVRYETSDQHRCRWLHCSTGLISCMSAGGIATPNPYMRKNAQ